MMGPKYPRPAPLGPPPSDITGPDCKKLADDYAATPTGAMDVLTYLKAMPGIGAIEPITLVGCGILAEVPRHSGADLP